MSPSITSPPCYLAEWYCPGLDQTQIGRIVADLDRCANSVAAVRSSVRRVLIVAVPDDDVVFGLFEADSPATIEYVCARAGIATSRITAAVADHLIRPQE